MISGSLHSQYAVGTEGAMETTYAERFERDTVKLRNAVGAKVFSVVNLFRALAVGLFLLGVKQSKLEANRSFPSPTIVAGYRVC
jgi:hypothetical protein